MKIWLSISVTFMMFDLSAQSPDSIFIKNLDSLIQLSVKYTEAGDYEKAIKTITEAEFLAESHFGKNSEIYAKCCFNHGKILYFSGNYMEAETWYVNSLNLFKQILKPHNTLISDNLNNLAILYNDLGRYDEAEPLYLEAMSILEKSVGKEDKEYARSLNNLANFYMDLGEYEKAESLHIEAKDLREKIFGKEHQDYASSLNNLSILYKNLGHFDKAEMLQIESKEIRLRVLGKEHPHYANSVSNLAIIYNEMGHYEKSKLLFIELRSLLEKLYGKNHPTYSNCLNGMGALYKNMGYYEEAEQFYMASKDIREKVFGKDHPLYTSCLINLSNLYTTTGKFDKAESLLQEAISIDVNIIGKDHPYYALDITNLAALYKEMGNYDKAIQLQKEAMAVREKNFGKESIYYAESEEHLGILYKETGRYEEAKLCLQGSNQIIEKTLGKNHERYAWSLNNLAGLFLELGLYRESEQLFLESMEIFKQVLGTDHQDYASSLGNIADLYYHVKRFDEAESYYLSSLKIIENILGKRHPIYLENMNHLAMTYENTNKPEQSEELLEEKFAADRIRLSKACTYLSERELEKYISTFQTDGHLYASYLLNSEIKNNRPRNRKLPDLLYDHSLFYKGFLLNNALKLQTMTSTSPVTLEKHKLLKSYRIQLSNEYLKPSSERKFVQELEDKENALEKEITRLVSDYATVNEPISWNAIKSKLNPEEAAIEFVSFKVNFPNKTDSIMYAALLVKPGSRQPQFIPLFEEKSLNSLLNSKSERKADYVNGLYTLADRGAMGLETPNKSLYEMLWKPLEKELGGIKTIYFSPSGLLHRLNLDAIPVSETETLADKYQLIELTSTRQLVIPDPIKIAGNDAVLFGGIQYEQDSTLQNLEPILVSRSRGELSFSSVDSNLRGGSWNYLSGTEREVNAIEKIMQTNGFQPELKKGYAATEESFKNIGVYSTPSPRILHIATHGYFFPDPKRNTNNSNLFDKQESVFKISEHPMLRSGLIMAGGNAAWQGKQIPEGSEDGILTAYEISQMNLSNTELVVLSACETGLGDIQGNEGVYGLQRAFKIAGAKYLIMSLWQVPDKQTSLLMTTFYKKWLEEKMTIPDAFHAAQTELRDIGLDPYQWAGFVLVE